MGLKSFTNMQITLRSQSQVVLPDSYVPGSSSDDKQTVHVDDYKVQDSLRSTSTPAPTELLSREITIAGGAVEIDLTNAKIVGAVDGGGDPAATEDLTGAKVFYLELHTDSGNAAAINVAPSASNGYELFGSGNADGIDLPPDSHCVYYCKGSSLPDVSAAAKGITFTGTNGDVINVVIAFEA